MYLSIGIRYVNRELMRNIFNITISNVFICYYIWKIKYANIRPKILDPFIHIEQLCCCIFYIYIIQYTHFIVYNMNSEYCCSSIVLPCFNVFRFRFERFSAYVQYIGR